MKPPTLPARVRAAVKGWITGTENYSPWYLDATGLVAGGLHRSAIDFAAEAGPADANAIVIACLNWVATALMEAPPRVQRTTHEMVRGRPITRVTPVPDHALIKLLDTPNEYYTGLDLLAAMAMDYNICGNGYWLAPLNTGGRPVELWYEPHFSIRAVGTATEFIARWEIYRGGTWQALNPREVAVVHFRRGIDPRDPRKGLSPLLAAARELYTDNQAAYWAATLLRNTGVPGVVIAPKDGATIVNKEAVKQAYMNSFTGDGRGAAMVLSEPADVFKLSWSPQEMDLTAIRRMPEERITALLGIPASVAGLGAGLDRNTFSNSEQEDDKAWHNNLIPTQRRMAATLEHRLLPLLGDPRTESVSFDLSQVKALQDDATDLYTRINIGYTGGWLKRSEARTATGWEVAEDGSDDVYKEAAPPALPAPAAPKALPAPLTKATPRPDATARRFRADVQGVLDTLYRQALAEVPDGKALSARRNGHSDHA